MMLIRRLSAALAVAVMPWVALALGSMAATAVASHSGSWGLESALSLGATAAASLVAAYLALTAAIAVIELAVRRFTRPRVTWKLSGVVAAVTPAAWSRVVATALGLSLVASPAMASSIDPVGSSSSSATWLTPAAAVNSTSDNASWGTSALPASASWLTETADQVVGVPAAPAHHAFVDDNSESHGELLTNIWGRAPQLVNQPLAQSAPATWSPSSAYVVQRGDSLWDITAALLGDSASDDVIAASWPSLYEANREAIGDDPGLIHPGTALTVPAAFAIEGQVQP